jgi:hypothetical protein
MVSSSIGSSMNVLAKFAKDLARLCQLCTDDNVSQLTQLSTERLLPDSWFTCVPLY